MSEHFNGLTPEVAELMAVLAEECGEVTQRIGKILRHGLRSVNPYTNVDNVTSLEGELTDIFTLVDILDKMKILSKERITAGILAKMERLSRPGMLHHCRMLAAKTKCVNCGSDKRMQREGTDGKLTCIDLRTCNGERLGVKW